MNDKRPTLNVRLLAVLFGAGTLSTGCFVYRPMPVQPRTGAQMRFELTDVGRVEMASVVGPGVRSVEGTLAELEDDEYVIDDVTLTLMRGDQAILNGVRIRLKQHQVTDIEQRRLSKTRTYPLAGGALALIAAFFVTRGFVKHGSVAELPPGPPPVDN